MAPVFLFLAGLLLFGPTSDSRAEVTGQLRAAVSELDRLGARPLWPGFDPRRVPIEIFDGERTWLLGHPSPPAEFEPTEDSRIRVFAGRHASVRANTSVAVAGVPTATVLLKAGELSSARRVAALCLHETFHVFQSRAHPKWGANEADLFLYPTENGEALALRRLESAALRKALAAGHAPEASAWAAKALLLRRERFERIPASAAAYERGTEIKEGLARYVEAGGEKPSEPLLPVGEFPAQSIRDRGYASGCAMALLLDSLDPRWKSRLEEKDDRTLEDLLGLAVAGAQPESFSPAEIERERRRAADEVKNEARRRSLLRRDFLAAPGWKVIVETKEPLFPSAFDPLNVERLSASEVLHTRWVKLGNASGTLEVLGRPCLTEAAGEHPLFQGVRRVTISGLPAEPRVEEKEGTVTLSGEGWNLGFRGARARTSGETVTLTLP